MLSVGEEIGGTSGLKPIIDDMIGKDTCVPASRVWGTWLAEENASFFFESIVLCGNRSAHRRKTSSDMLLRLLLDGLLELSRRSVSSISGEAAEV